MTLNEILIDFKNYLQNHPLLESCSLTLSDEDFNALNSQQYPTSNIQYIDSTTVGTTFTHNIKIILADLSNPNVEDIDFEILSDLMRIAGDFFVYLDGDFRFDWTKTSNIQPFVDSNVDRMTGIVFTIGVTNYIDSTVQPSGVIIC